MTELHPCFGPEHAKEHDDRWCTDCDRAWAGSEWQEERVPIFADLLRRTAAALGKPTEGSGSSWHDIPDVVADLVVGLDVAQQHMEAMQRRAAMAEMALRGLIKEALGGHQPRPTFWRGGIGRNSACGGPGTACRLCATISDAERALCE